MEHLPYARHQVDDQDIAAVIQVLKSDWLTTGPKVTELEDAIGQRVGCDHVVAVNSGTAALHCAMHAIGIGPDDEVIVPSMTFAATANSVLYQGGRPIFADVDPSTLLVDPEDVRRKISPRTKAVVAVDYAGQPCDYGSLQEICDRYRLALIADACHSFGGGYRGTPVGRLADLTCCSMHPVKPITSGEGGFVTTHNAFYAARMRSFRNHGIDLDYREREQRATWRYAMNELGFNYRLCDIQCALALSQLSKLDQWTHRRNLLATRYREALVESGDEFARPLRVSDDVRHAYHLFVVRWNSGAASISRDVALQSLRQCGIGVNVHYCPVYLHPYYQRRLRYRAGICPHAERAAAEILSLPMFPAMTHADVDWVVDQLQLIVRSVARTAA